MITMTEIPQNSSGTALPQHSGSQGLSPCYDDDPGKDVVDKPLGDEADLDDRDVDRRAVFVADSSSATPAGNPFARDWFPSMRRAANCALRLSPGRHPAGARARGSIGRVHACAAAPIQECIFPTFA